MYGINRSNKLASIHFETIMWADNFSRKNNSCFETIKVLFEQRSHPHLVKCRHTSVVIQRFPDLNPYAVVFCKIGLLKKTTRAYIFLTFFEKRNNNRQNIKIVLLQNILIARVDLLIARVDLLIARVYTFQYADCFEKQLSYNIYI